MRYKPISIRELLTELHTISTLIIDLAYSAVLFDDYELAEEVIELEEKGEDLISLLLMNTALVIRDADDAEAMIGIMRMGSVAEKISKSAGDIARIVLSGLKVDPYIIEVFNKTQERLVRVKILPNSILSEKSIGKLNLEANIGIDIIAVRRGKQLYPKPKHSLILLEGDVLIARGGSVGVLELSKLANGELRSIPKPKIDEKEMGSK